MEHIDKDMEQQVWQRVLSQRPEPPRDDLRALQLTAMELAAAYRHLAGQLTGKARERAKELYEGEMTNAACLKGMRILSGGGAEKPKGLLTPKEPAEKVLRGCYHHSRRAMAEYTARTMDGEFGAVFQKMAQREGEHCAVIAELLGNIVQGK